MASPSPTATPKRKRGQPNVFARPAEFTFDLLQAGYSEDGGTSPQSRVAHRFRALALESEGGMPDDVLDDGVGTQKRQKSDDVMTDAVRVAIQDGNSADSPGSRSRPHVSFKPRAAVLDSPLGSVASVDDVERLDPNSAPCQRASSPPSNLNTSPTGISNLEDSGGRMVEDLEERSEEDDDVVEPIRAALTWHEDEITVYDPDDEDDDGTGVNGLGFRPTPALAHARAMRRRRQMAEYRKREEGEARNKRSQGRRGEGLLSARPKKKSPARKVRFLDLERKHLPVTTQEL